jgi:hypothetical protein
VRNKGELADFAALQQLRTDRPFPLLGLECDDGDELINYNLLRHCQAEGIP